MKKLLGVLFLALVSAAGASANDNEIVLNIASTPMGNIFSKITKPFEEKTGMKIKYLGPKEGGSSEEALMSVEKGEAEGGAFGSGWEDMPGILKDKHIEGIDLSQYKSRVIGMDKVQFYAHKGVGVQKLGKDQLKGILTGSIKNWKELGGKDLPITVVLCVKQPAAGKNVKKKVMDGGDFTASAKSTADVNEMRKVISTTPGAFGFGAIGLNDGNYPMLDLDHPEFGRPLTFFTKGVPSAKILKLLDFIQGEGRKYHVK